MWIIKNWKGQKDENTISVSISYNDNSLIPLLTYCAKDACLEIKLNSRMHVLWNCFFSCNSNKDLRNVCCDFIIIQVFNQISNTNTTDKS